MPSSSGLPLCCARSDRVLFLSMDAQGDKLSLIRSLNEKAEAASLSLELHSVAARGRLADDTRTRSSAQGFRVNGRTLLMVLIICAVLLTVVLFRLEARTVWPTAIQNSSSAESTDTQQQQQSEPPQILGCLRPRAAVVYLMAPHRMDEMVEALHNLEVHFMQPYEHRYPVLIFSEARPSLVDQQRIRASTRATLEFVLLEGFDRPQPTTEPFDEEVGFVFGYRHMIRFWFAEVFHHPRVAMLDYFWRLDTDSRLREPMPYDPFQLIACTGVDYAYKSMNEDDGKYARGLTDWIAAYLNRTGIQPLQHIPIPSKPGNSFGFYNNFELVRVKAFLQPQVLQFVEDVMRTGYIYSRRWGDALLRFYTVLIFLSRNATLQLCDVNYFHFYEYPPECYNDSLLPQHILILAALLQKHGVGGPHISLS